MVESAVVGFGISDHKLVRTLITGHNLYPSFSHPSRIHHCHQLVQQRRLLFEQIGRFRFDGLFKLVRIAPWYTVPRLCLAPVHVIDRIGIVILIVPAESGEEHADVDPGYSHSGYIGFDEPQ